MDLSFGLTGAQQWLLLIALCFALSLVCFAVANRLYNRFEYKANWTARLSELKTPNRVCIGRNYKRETMYYWRS